MWWNDAVIGIDASRPGCFYFLSREADCYAANKQARHWGGKFQGARQANEVFKDLPAQLNEVKSELKWKKEMIQAT